MLYAQRMISRKIFLKKLAKIGLKPQLIHTRENTYQRIEVLKRNRKKRSEYNQFVVESVAAIKAAVANKWKIEGLCFSYDRDLSNWAEDLISSNVSSDLFAMSSELMGTLSEKDETSEIIAIVKCPKDDITRINIKHSSILAVLDRPHSPGNLGTIIRSADAVGACGVIVLGHAADIYDPHTVRSSLGTLFSIPVVRVASPNTFVSWLKSQPIPIHLLGTSAKAEKTIFDYKIQLPLALVFGNETTGLSKTFQLLCDDIVKLPMKGSASSINLACAATVFLYHAAEEAQKNLLRNSCSPI